MLTSRARSSRKEGSRASTPSLNAASSSSRTPAPAASIRRASINPVYRRRCCGGGVRSPQIPGGRPSLRPKRGGERSPQMPGGRASLRPKGGPGRHAVVGLGARVPPRQRPHQVAVLAAWIRRLRADHDEGRDGTAVHLSSDPGHWILTYPWSRSDRGREIAEAAFHLAERDISPARSDRQTGRRSRLVARWNERIEAAGGPPPTWLRDADRRIPVVSRSGTNGPSTTTRLTTAHLLLAARDLD